MGDDLTLACFPATDRAFVHRTEVLAVEAGLTDDERTGARLQAVLRELYYPAAVVSRREPLAADPTNPAPTWYVFRDGAVAPVRRRPRRVLVVDDDEAFVDVLRTLLVDAGFAVREARDGIEALEVAATFAPDLILLDLIMPRVTGEEFARLYRHEPEPRAQIVVMSGLPEASDIALQIGARAVVPKPFEVEPLLDLLAQYA